MGLTAYQAHMKRELKGNMSGKTAAQRKAIFKAAAASFKKSSKPSRISRAVKRVRTARTSARNTNGGNHTGKGGFNTAKLFKVIRMGSLVAPGVVRALEPADPMTKAARVVRAYTGYDIRNGTMSLSSLAEGWGPYVLTSLVTYGIPKLTSLIRGI